MKKVAHLQKTPSITTQDIVHVLILVALSLLFCLVPAVSSGQPIPGNVSDPFSALDFSAPPPATAALAPAPAPVAQATPATSEVTAPAVPFGASQAKPEIPPALPEPPPAPVAAEASPVTASQFQPTQRTVPYQQQSLRTPPLETVASAEHPFRQYLGVPNDPQAGVQTKITGKPMTVAELFAGTRSSAVRCQLLQAYWELSGLLAVYHFRCENEKLASGAAGAAQDGTLTLLREQRRTAEVEFIKQQWVLAECLKQYKGRTLRESELPIPTDYPLYPRYQTHADKIARTERTQYLGRMIPLQEQLIESKTGTWKAASEMAQSATQPFFMASNQRTMAFLDLTTAIIEYNQMIAEYALDTIPANVSQQQLVGAVVRLQKRSATPERPQPPQVATQGIKQAQFEAPAGMTVPPVERIASEFSATPIAVVEPEAEPAPEPPSNLMEIQ